MALLQITEPGQALDPHQRKRAAGIDLGTTNSLIASVRGGVAETLWHNTGAIVLHGRARASAFVGSIARGGAAARALVALSPRPRAARA